MKKIALLIGLVVITSFLFSGTASAAPKSGKATFHFEGVFSTTEKPTEARLDFTGKGDIWGEKPFLGKMKGSLMMDKGGPDESERNLRVKPEGDIGIKHWGEDFGFVQCTVGDYKPGKTYSHGEDRWTIISVGANELHGTGELWWGWEESCLDGNIIDEFGYGMMRAALVGGHTAGLFRQLDGPEPSID